MNKINTDVKHITGITLWNSEQLDDVNVSVKNISNIKENQDIEYYEGLIDKLSPNQDNIVQIMLDVYHNYIKENQNIYEKWNFLKRYVCKYRPDFKVKLFLIYPKTIQIIVDTGIYKSYQLIEILLSLNYYLHSKQDISIIDIKNYISENLEHVNYWIWNDICESYKNSPNWVNPYTGKQFHIEGPFSLIDLETKAEINSIQVAWKEIPIWEQRFYSINDRIPVKLQLIINKLFAPYIWMTRLIQIRNKKENQVVSIDVNHKQAEHILGYKENTPENIKDLLRIIYQFIAMDNDRRAEWNHNIENDIIYDFEWIWAHHFIDFTDKNNINLTFKKNQYKEIAEIIYFFKTHIYSTSEKEIARLSRLKQEGEEIDEEIYNFWKQLQIRSRMLNMINIICWCKKNNLINMALKIDTEIKEIDKKNVLEENRSKVQSYI